MREVPVPFCLHMRLKGHCQGLLGWDMETDSGGHPIRSEGRRSFVHEEVLDHPHLQHRMAGSGKGPLPLSKGHV